MLCSIINIECLNAQKRFDKPILSVFVNSNECHLNSLDIHCNGYSQIFFENLLPNLRFGVEIVNIFTISTFYNHYKAFIKEHFRLKPSSGDDFDQRRQKGVIGWHILLHALNIPVPQQNLGDL